MKSRLTPVNTTGTSSVLFLGRYWHAEPRNLSDLKHQFAGLRLSYKTVHGVQGLGSRLRRGARPVRRPTWVSYGDCRRSASQPGLSASEEHPNAEERRLFYVALTRARRRVFLLADGGLPSPFVMELLDDAYDVTAIGSTLQGWVPCPTCVMGRLERRDNASDRSTFYGCSNWPYCKYTQSACLACGTGLPVAEEEHFPSVPTVRRSLKAAPDAMAGCNRRPVDSVLFGRAPIASMRLHARRPARRSRESIRRRTVGGKAGTGR